MSTAAESALRVRIVPAEQTRLQVESLRGPKGADGFSPRIELETLENGVRVTAVNRDGEETAVIRGSDTQTTDDALVLETLAQYDLLRAVGSGDGVLCDEDGNVLEW